jgi:DNA-binding MarR family transcriptional regulator
MKPEKRAEIIRNINRKINILGPLMLSRMTNIDITMTQLKVVMLLFHKSPLRVGDIATFLGVSNPTASDLVDRLVERGIVKRQHDETTDRRVVLCCLSDQTKNTISEFWNIERERREGIFAAMTVTQMQAINGVLDIVIDITQKETRKIILSGPEKTGGN